MKILRTASVAIHVRASFVVLALLYALAHEAGPLLSLLLLAALFVTFLGHELGHIIVARFMKRPTETTIGGAGGKTIVFGPALKTWQRVLVLLSGVFASYLLVEGTAWLLQKGFWPHVVVQQALISIYSLSVLWFWCNLIPLYPFDGGEITVVLGGALFGRIGRILAVVLNMAVGISLVIYCLFEGMFGGAIIALYSLTETFLLVRRPQSLHGGVLSDDAQKLHDLQQRWLSGEQEQVVAELRLLAEKSGEADVRRSALDLCSEYLLELDRFREAYDLLSNAKDTLQLASLEHLALSGYKTSHWDEALEAGREAFRQCPSLSTASLCAALAARLSLDEESVGWLRAAQSMGFRNVAEFVSTADFDPIRSSTVLKQFLEGLGN